MWFIGRASLLLSCVLLNSVRAQVPTIIATEPIPHSEALLDSIASHDSALAAQLADIDISRIAYTSDGLRVRGYLLAPRTGDSLPVIIANRGGVSAFGAWTDFSAAVMLGRLASWGYIVLASQYRGNVGGEGQDEYGGADVNDVLNLIPIAEQLPRADASRIGMWGWSRGGLETFVALTKTDRIAAAVIGSAPVDVARWVEYRPDMARVFSRFIPEFTTTPEAALVARSALAWPERLHKGTPILLMHGSSDWRVPPAEVFDMGAALWRTEHPFRLVFFEGGDHGITEHRDEVNRLTRAWFDAYVRDGLPWPSLEPHGR
jgi:dipeptidyl aminopeptidase/acylaminoacyl peptidase